ncbi:MAG: hypothetical protein OEM82_00290 [Acidobacteriota bacterium]|nr:hypothetical protein [Acidobacteriota bacterium]MDH3529525.1 hypothetical protein [Acidobacteriota bacterium]
MTILTVDLRRYPKLWLLAGVSLFLVSNGNWTISLAAWLAPVFLLRFARTCKAMVSIPVLLLFFPVATYFMLYGIIPPNIGALTYIFTVYFGLLWLLPYIVDRLLYESGRGFLMTLVFPATAVAVEYLNGLFFGTWGAIAYTQAGNLPFLQMMSVTGMWGPTFLVMWLGPVVNWAWEREWRLEDTRSGLAIYVGIVALVFLAGGARLAFSPQETETRKVAVVIGNQELKTYKDELNKTGHESLAELARADAEKARVISNDLVVGILNKSKIQAQTGAEFIIWPESFARVMESDEAGVLRLAGEFARSESVHLQIAYYRYPPDFPDTYARNKTVMFLPNGKIAWQYIKSSLVPGVLEIPGDWIIPAVKSGEDNLGTSICYDMDYPNLIRQAGQKDIELMIVPSWDWAAINPLHTEMAVFRAIENGFSMVRATADGTSIAVDPYGRVMSQMDSFASKDGVMSANLPVASRRTVYSFIGDLFAWLCLAAMLMFVTKPVYDRIKQRGAG